MAIHRIFGRMRILTKNPAQIKGLIRILRILAIFQKVFYQQQKDSEKKKRL